MRVERRVVRVFPSARGERLRARAEAREKLRREDVRLILDGTVDKLRERGVDLLDHSPRVGSADGGAGRDEQADLVMGQQSSSEGMSAWIRQRVEEGKEMRDKIKRLPNAIPDAALIPDDPHQGEFEDRNLWGG